MRILVTGATGFVGGQLVGELLAAGHEVRALVRDPSSYDAPNGVEVFQGDVLDRGSFEDSLSGVDAAYYLIHSMYAGEDFEERDRLAARNFTRAASEAGVDRIIYLGGLGETGDQLSAHLRSRREVEYILGDGTPELTTLRASIIVGAGSVSFQIVTQLVKRLPVMIAPQWVRTQCQPIAVIDALAYLVGVVDAPETAGKTYEIGGPDILTYGEMLQQTALAMDRRPPPIVPVPVLTPKLSAYWVGLVSDVDWQVARPLIHGLKNPTIVTDDSIREFVSPELTPFSEAVQRALAEEGG
ncbi:NAD(P)H-binding protein [Halovenus sp. HT40]|uniref:NAD(P)H-binding protein n=1 Tax=Halovenus sp. HT40 TaxID=3126691 RepID=UPI00300EE01D